jgi:hypothetical protein
MECSGQYNGKHSCIPHLSSLNGIRITETSKITDPNNSTVIGLSCHKPGDEYSENPHLFPRSYAHYSTSPASHG